MFYTQVFTCHHEMKMVLTHPANGILANSLDNAISGWLFCGILRTSCKPSAKRKQVPAVKKLPCSDSIPCSNSPSSIKNSSAICIKLTDKGNIRMNNIIPEFLPVCPNHHRFHPKMKEMMSKEPTSEEIEKVLKAINELLESLGELPVNQDLPMPSIMRGASITIESLKKLFPGTILNDIVIDFFCLYLTRVKYAKQQDRFIIYSSFFYRSLEKFILMDAKYQSNLIQRKRSVNMFEKEFVIFPANVKNAHWIAFVICCPNEIKEYLVYKSGVENSEEGACGLPRHAVYVPKETQDSKQECLTPCMLMFDSMVKHAVDIFPYIRQYLAEEYKRFYNVEVNFENFPGYVVACPQQCNITDCGVYTMQNIEMVLENIDVFKRYHINMGCAYAPAHILNKRKEVMTLIVDLITEAVQERESVKCHK